MNHNNVKKHNFSISQSYTTSSVCGDGNGDGILMKSSLKKTKTMSIKCSISEVLRMSMKDRKSMKDINGVRDDDRPVVTIIQPTTTSSSSSSSSSLSSSSSSSLSSSSSSSSSMLAQLSKQPVSDTRGSFDKLHKYITVSDLTDLSVTIGEGKLNRHHTIVREKLIRKMSL